MFTHLPMFRLQHVLLIALDVVKGPYMHCCAPAGPSRSHTQDCCCHAEGHVLHASLSSCSGDSDNAKKRNPNCSRSNTTTGSCRCGNGTSAAVNHLSGFSDVFVPRSEFCRRVMCLLEAESGLLHLFYPEEIAGLHYQRKTLRYTLCFVFRINEGLVTINETLTERLVRPYSAVLVSIMEELREAELRYGYMSRGLARSSNLSCSGCQEVEQQQRRMYDGETVGGTDASTTSTAADASVFAPPMNRDDTYTTSSKWAARVNVFLTPLQDPTTLHWTPLEEMMEMLYTCLSCEDEEMDEEQEQEPEEAITVDQQQQQQQHLMLLLQPKKKFPVKERIAAVRISETLSFYVRRVAQPHVPLCHALNEVPIPIADCTVEMLDWADLAICDVFKAVDGRRTIADIVQILAAGCEPFEDDTHKAHRMPPLLGSPCTIATPYAMPTMLSYTKGAMDGTATNAPIRSANVVQLSASAAPSPPLTHGIEMRPFSPLSIGKRSSMSATPAAQQRGYNQPRVHGERQADDATTSSYDGQLHSWLAELELIVLEALQHLEVHNYVRIIRPCHMHRTYSTTKELYRVMCNRQHIARRIIGHRMLATEERCGNFGEQPNMRRSRQAKGIGMGGEPVESTVGGYTLTLPAVLLTTAALEQQEEEDEKQRRQRQQQQQIDDGTMMPLPCSALKIPISTPSSVIMSSADDMTSEAANGMEDVGGANPSTYTEAEIEAAAAAALYALGKFTNCTIANVQREMRRNPLWSSAFARWEDVCCTSLAQIALLNGWLVEVPAALPFGV